MVKRKLVEGLVSDGAKLLSELDRVGFNVESMFWIHLPEEDYWRLVIASPLVAEQGSTAGYRRLDDLLRSLRLAALTLEDISLLDPASSNFRALYSLAGESSRLAPGRSWLEFEDAIVYRWTGASLQADLDCDVSARELQEFWDAEREGLQLNQPALLISKEGKRITLRVHPQHGPRQDVAGIKQGFQIALHRTDARPSCHVTWLD
jgi:hypothetical protein